MTRRLGDLLQDLRNPNLSRQRLDEIVREANEFYDKANKANAWTSAIDPNPQVDILRARSGIFEVSPVDGILFENTSAITCADSVLTEVNWTSYTGDTNSFKWSSSTRIGVNQQHYLVGVFGTMQWPNNGVGRRGMGLNAYDSTGTQVYGVTLCSVPPTGVDVDTIPFSGGIKINRLRDVQSIGFQIVQTSGGALNASFIRAYLFVMK
jgi:hypothetical protein